MNTKSRQLAARHRWLKSKSLGCESDGLAFWLFMRFCELLNHFENRFELSVVSLLHLCEFSCQFLVGHQQFAKPDKRSHNLDACLNSLLATENASQHQRPVFRKYIWLITAPATAMF